MERTNKLLLIFLIVLMIVILIIYAEERINIGQKTVTKQRITKQAEEKYYQPKVVSISINTKTDEQETKKIVKKEKIINNTFVLNGDYKNLGFVSGNYLADGASLDLHDNSVKIVCPDGFVVPPSSKSLVFGAQAKPFKCDKTKGCDVFYFMYLNGSGFFSQWKNESQNTEMKLIKNDNNGVGIVCVKDGQLKDWI